MKYLKLFENFTSLILFHGTPYNFKSFKNRVTFFSDNPKFARDYSETKSQDAEMDNTTKIAECEFNGNLFEYNNESDMNKLIEIMPDKTNVSHGTMWFLDADFDKSEMIKRLKGIATITPIDYIANANIGDEVSDPSYKPDKMIVVDKNEDTIYTIDKKNYLSYLSSSSMGFDEHWKGYTKYKDIFKPWRQSIVDAYNKNNGTNISLPEHSSFDKIYNTYKYVKLGKTVGGYEATGGPDDFWDYIQYKYLKNIFTKEQIEFTENLYSKCLKEFEALAKKELSRTEWNRKTIDETMTSNWTYYENKDISNLIKKLGYDGYVALEDGHKTYAIYEPSKTIKILEIN